MRLIDLLETFSTITEINAVIYVGDEVEVIEPIKAYKLHTAIENKGLETVGGKYTITGIEEVTYANICDKGLLWLNLKGRTTAL